MKICIVSAFRNAVQYIERYCEQMDDLQKLLVKDGRRLHLLLGYGDSTDGTAETLFDECSNRFDAHLLDVSHGGHHFGSVVHSERFRQLASVGNQLWRQIPEDAEIVGLVESDLIWSGKDLYSLILEVRFNCLVSPLTKHLDGRFYDTWAYRMNGKNFYNEPPYHPGLNKQRYYAMDSVGSVFFMQGELARRLQWPEKDVVVGFCRLAREAGASILLDTDVEVYHP